jgi:hypothetical protein
MLVRDYPAPALLPQANGETKSILGMGLELRRRAAPQESVRVADVLSRRHIQLDDFEGPSLSQPLEKWRP